MCTQESVRERRKTWQDSMHIDESCGDCLIDPFCNKTEGGLYWEGKREDTNAFTTMSFCLQKPAR